jgi:hypothetical protein
MRTAAAIPADLRIPAPPRARRIALPRPREAAWREAMRWSIVAITASTVAGEITLLLLGF